MHAGHKAHVAGRPARVQPRPATASQHDRVMPRAGRPRHAWPAKARAGWQRVLASQGTRGQPARGMTRSCLGCPKPRQTSRSVRAGRPAGLTVCRHGSTPVDLATIFLLRCLCRGTHGTHVTGTARSWYEYSRTYSTRRLGTSCPAPLVRTVRRRGSHVAACCGAATAAGA